MQQLRKRNARRQTEDQLHIEANPNEEKGCTEDDPVSSDLALASVSLTNQAFSTDKHSESDDDPINEADGTDKTELVKPRRYSLKVTHNRGREQRRASLEQTAANKNAHPDHLREVGRSRVPSAGPRGELLQQRQQAAAVAAVVAAQKRRSAPPKKNVAWGKRVYKDVCMYRCI